MFDFCISHLNALVVVVDCDGQLLLGLVLADHILVQKRLHLGWLGQVCWRRTSLSFTLVVFENGVAHRHALIADVRARVVRRRRDELGNGVLRFMAERTTERLFRAT